MEKEKKTILVTCDFTQVSENALEHAIKISKVVKNEITLIHICKKQNEIEEATNKLNIVAEETYKKHKIKPKVIAQEGSIFTTINEAASELNANLVIMGTHGIRGMQKLTGSWALKVIIGSEVPFVVVQEPPTHERFNNIVFPIDFRAETKEKLNWAIYLAKYYQTKLYIFKSKVTDATLVRKVNNNINFAKKILSSKEIKYEITSAMGKKSFSNETINFAHEIDADLILIMTTRNIDFTDYVLGADEQKIIANSAKIPVMCVNPRTDLRKLAGFG